MCTPVKQFVQMQRLAMQKQPQQEKKQHASEAQHKKEYVAKQQRWLLFLRHCAKCQAAEGQCTYGQSCTIAKQLWRHMLTCTDPNCKYPRCSTAGSRGPQLTLTRWLQWVTTPILTSMARFCP